MVCKRRAVNGPSGIGAQAFPVFSDEDVLISKHGGMCCVHRAAREYTCVMIDRDNFPPMRKTAMSIDHHAHDAHRYMEYAVEYADPRYREVLRPVYEQAIA